MTAFKNIAIGTAGLATEWVWSHLAMRLPWSVDLLPEAAA